MPPGRRRHLAVPQKALLHDPDLVGIAPVPATAWRIRSNKNFNLGSELMVGHKVGLSTAHQIPSDGPRRRDTLGATTEKQRKGIADYFNPTVPINRISGGGEGAFGGDSVFSEDTMAQSGTGAGLVRPTAERQARGTAGSNTETPEEPPPDPALAEVEDALLAFSGESAVQDLLRQHIITRLSDEGLVIEIFDRDGAALFAPDGSPTPEFAQMAPPIIEALSVVVNDIAIQGHVASRPVVLRSRAPWTEAVERADHVRELLEDQGLEPSRSRRVTGFGDTVPVTSDPMAIRNNRIEIVVLREGV